MKLTGLSSASTWPLAITVTSYSNNKIKIYDTEETDRTSELFAALILTETVLPAPVDPTASAFSSIFGDWQEVAAYALEIAGIDKEERNGVL